MHVGAAGGGLPNLDPVLTKALTDALLDATAPLTLSSSPHTHAKADSVSDSLAELSTPAMVHLLQVVEDRLHIHLSKASGENAGSVTPDARGAAERSVSKAAHAIETSVERSRAIPDNLDPRMVLALANQFIEVGSVANYFRAEELGRTVVSWYDGPLPLVAFVPEASPSPRVQRALQKLWRRAPLAVLFLGWLVAGIVGGVFLRLLSVPAYSTAVPFDIWGLGFLLLVVLQFVVTVRGALLRR